MSKTTVKTNKKAGPVQAHSIGFHVCDTPGCSCGNGDVRFTFYSVDNEPIAYGFLTAADARDVVDRLAVRLGRPAGATVQ